MRSLLLRAAALALATLSARAHDVFPATISLRPGGEDFIYVADQGTCPASITVTSTNPAAVKVYSINMTTGAVNSGNGTSASVANRVDQVFVVRAAPNLTISAASSLQVCWVGANYPGGPCGENNCSPFVPHIVPVTVKPLPATAGSNLSAAVAGDPIETDRGEFVMTVTADLDLGGVMPLDFRRYYSSRVALEANTSSTLGPGWLHNFAWRLQRTGHNVEVSDDTGRVIRFEKGYLDSAWSLAVVDDIPYQLIESVQVYTVANPIDGLLRCFDLNGRMTSISDGRGNLHTLSYSGGLLSSASDGLGRVLNFIHTAGRLSSVSDGTRTVSFGHDGSGRLSSATDAAGKTTSYAYSASVPSFALLTSITLPKGNTPYVQTYDVNSRVASQTDALGRVMTFSYDTVARTTTLTDALSRTQLHDYDSDGDLTSWQDEGGATAGLQNDAEGRRTAITDRLGRTSSWTIHAPSGRIARKTESDGGQTTFGYAPRSAGGFTLYDLTTITYADGTTDSFSYDANGNRTGWTDRGAHNWSYTFNGRGQVLTETNPLGAIRSYTYNADATLASITDPITGLSSFSYDALRRVDEVTFADSTMREYTYDALDRVVSVTDEKSAVTTFGRDDNGNVTSITAPSSQVWTLDYDVLDRLTSVTDPLGNSSSASYDELGRVSGLLDATGKGISLGYDPRGRLWTAELSTGEIWSNAHDAEGVPISSSAPGGELTTYASDSLGRITRATSPLGAVTQRSFDLLGRVRSCVDAAGKSTSLAYDALGNLSSFALPFSGATASFTRNALGQAVSVTLPGGAQWTSSYSAEGALDSTTDPLGRATGYGHDARGRVDHATFPGGLGSVSYEFDGASRLTRRLYSDGLDISYVYDPHGRVTGTDGLSLGYDLAGRMTSCNGLTIGRDAAGRVISVTYAPGQTVQYAYDARGLGTSFTDWFSGTTNYTYDQNGNNTGIARPNGIDTSRSFNADDKLTRILERDAASTTLSDTQLDYEPRGLLKTAIRTVPLSAVPPSADLSFDHDAAQQLKGWTWDELGRTLSDGHDFWCNYDLGSRLTKLTLGPEVHDLRYDGFDNLTGWTTGGHDYDLIRNYAFRSAAPAKLSIDGVVRFSYVADFDGALFSTYDHVTQQVRFHHYDERGSTLYRTDATGGITDSYAYDPSGALLDHNGGDENPFRHLGRDWALSFGTGRIQYENKAFIDTCTLRNLVRRSPTLMSMYAVWTSSWFGGDGFFGSPRADATELIDQQWLGSQASLTAKLEPRLQLQLGYDWNHFPDLGTTYPAGNEVPEQTPAQLEARYQERVPDDFSFGRSSGVVAENSTNYRETVAKFRAARALARYLKPPSANERLRQRVIDMLAVRTAYSLALTDSFSLFTPLLLERGPAELRGALQDPDSLRWRLSGNGLPFLGLPLIGGLFRGHAARTPLQLLIRPYIVSEQ